MFKQIKERWNSETPKFFKGVRKVAITIGVSATSVWLANSTMSLGLPEIILDVCKYSIAACAAMGFTSQLTKVNSNDATT